MKQLAAALALTLTLLACSSSDDGPSAELATEEDRSTADVTEPDETTTTEPAANVAAITDYFEKLADGRATSYNDALELAEPDSPAALYARYLFEVARIDGFTEPSNMTEDGDTITFCYESEPDNCFDLGDFRVNDAGQLVNFTIGGNLMSDRILGAGQPTTSGPVTVTRVVAYNAVSGGVFVVVDITNNSDAPITAAGYEATYTSPDGRQQSVAFSGLSNDVGAGATATDYTVFEVADLGGTLSYRVFADDFATELNFEIPIS